MLKVWNVSLVLATGTLAVMGTFLVRSGVLNSIHAFGGATLGVPFVVLIAVLIAGSIYLVVSRREMLRSEHRLDSLLSREAVFIANNLVLVGALLRDLLGHLLPADLRGAHRPGSLRRAAVVRPLHGAAGADPGASQRDRARDRVAPRDARQRAAQLPRAACCARCSTLAVLLAAGRRTGSRFALAMFCCAAFVFGSVGQEFVRGTRARRAIAGEPRAAGAAVARPAQPPPLRRLHRAPRDRGAVHRRRRLLVLPARLRAVAVARPVDAGGRLHRPLREADRDDHPQVRRGPHRLDAQPRREARRQQGRPPRRHAEPQRGLLRLAGCLARAPSAASSAASR